MKKEKKSDKEEMDFDKEGNEIEQQKNIENSNE